LTRPALVLTAPGAFGIEWRERPRVGPGQVLVDISHVGLCGTDLHIVDGSHPRARFPLVLGHELVGTAIGGRRDGRSVVVDPLIACGSCAACRLGHGHVCARLRLIGIDRDGGLGGWLAVDEDRLHDVPDGMDPVLAALAEPAAVAIHAVRRAAVVPGETVLVIGAGPIGLLLAIVAREFGAALVLISEPSAERAAFAHEAGFEMADPGDLAADVSGRTSGDLADVVFDAAAAPAVAAILPTLVRPAGRIALVGTYDRPVEVDLQAILFREQTLLGNRVYTPTDIDAALAFLSRDGASVRPMISGIFALDDAPAAFDQLRAGHGVKYLVAVGAD
jgi:(R,R)-butanediol dehydrogenase/meso-butanediol dehydrogenase/diacetyl reductase